MKTKLFFISRRLHIKEIWIVLLVLLIQGCITPYPVSIEDESSHLVVHAIITDEFKNQVVTLSRSFSFNIDESPKESNAVIYIETANGIQYPFIESEVGTYKSQEAFRAELDQNYTLNIQTKDGNSYVSKTKQLPSHVTIDQFDIIKKENSESELGISFELSSHGSNFNGGYYRVGFEETYKIVAPYWSAYDAVIFSEGRRTFDLRTILRETEEQTCYGFYKPSKIDIVNTTLFEKDTIASYPVRFLKQSDPRGMHRYSILVKQYSIDKETLSYYETLKNLSDASSTVFTESQPGQISGNMESVSNKNEVVLGYFEVSGVDSKRVFIDYTDFYPGENRPPFFYSCVTVIPSVEGEMGSRPLLQAIENDDLIYFASTEIGNPYGPFYMVFPFCGDCTRIGSNNKPEFWEESTEE